jgi:hypothetical protein
MVLHGDSGGCVAVMLRACYCADNTYPLQPPWSAAGFAAARNMNTLIRFHIGMYATADRYRTPRVQVHAAKHVGDLLKQYIALAVAHTAHIPAINFPQILAGVYKVTAPWDENEALRKTVLDIIVITNPATSSTGPPGVLKSIITQYARNIPDFGRDMYLRMTEDPASLPAFSHVQTVEEVQCLACGGFWFKPKNWVVCRCINCGVERNWSGHLVTRAGVIAALEAAIVGGLGEDDDEEDDEDEEEEEDDEDDEDGEDDDEDDDDEEDDDEDDDDEKEG